MISSPVYYHRQYANELPQCTQITPDIAKTLAAALPLLSFYTPLRTPLSIGMGLLRNITHLQEIQEALTNNNYSKVTIKSAQLLLSLSAIALLISALVTPYINPSLFSMVLGLDDVISNLVNLKKATAENDINKIIENVAQLISSLLYMAFIHFGQIEFLVACMVSQILFNLGRAKEEFRQGNYLGCLCHLIHCTLMIVQIIPQIKVMHWKWNTTFPMEGQLCRDSRGFVYLKVQDEMLYELNHTLGDGALPPYFGKGMHGAHITVIGAEEMAKDVAIADLGKIFKFNIAFVNTVKPDNFKGVEAVSFASVHCPELDTLRSSLGLTGKMHGYHDFHITYGVQYAS